MIIKMLKDAYGSYNGVDSKLYKEGEVYRLEHPNEKNLFPMLVAGGSAEFYDPARPAKEIKVMAPAETKIAAPKAKKAKKAD